MQCYFLTEQIFFHPPKILKSPKYTAILSEFSFPKKGSEFSFPKKGKEFSLNFGWQIYVMAEPRILWSYEKFYI